MSIKQMTVSMDTTASTPSNSSTNRITQAVISAMILPSTINFLHAEAVSSVDLPESSIKELLAGWSKAPRRRSRASFQGLKQRGRALHRFQASSRQIESLDVCNKRAAKLMNMTNYNLRKPRMRSRRYNVPHMRNMGALCLPSSDNHTPVQIHKTKDTYGLLGGLKRKMEDVSSSEGSIVESSDEDTEDVFPYLANWQVAVDHSSIIINVGRTEDILRFGHAIQPGVLQACLECVFDVFKGRPISEADYDIDELMMLLEQFADFTDDATENTLANAAGSTLANGDLASGAAPFAAPTFTESGPSTSSAGTSTVASNTLASHMTVGLAQPNKDSMIIDYVNTHNTLAVHIMRGDGTRRRLMFSSFREGVYQYKLLATIISRILGIIRSTKPVKVVWNMKKLLSLLCVKGI